MGPSSSVVRALGSPDHVLRLSPDRFVEPPIRRRGSITGGVRESDPDVQDQLRHAPAARSDRELTLRAEGALRRHPGQPLARTYLRHIRHRSDTAKSLILLL